MTTQLRIRDLKYAFLTAIQHSSDVGGNPYIAIGGRKSFNRLIELLEDESLKDDWSEEQGLKLLRLLKNDKNAFLDTTKVGVVLTTLGEVDCYWLCKKKQIDIQSNDRGTPGYKEKRADFVIECSDGPLYLEVKTPGPFAADYTINKHLSEGLDQRASMENDIEAGARVAWATQTIPFFQNETHDHPTKYQAHYFIDRVNNNYKAGQHLDDTILVLNMLWSPYTFETKDLYMTYPAPDGGWDTEDIGILWMAGFGQPGDITPLSFDMALQRDHKFEREGFFVNPNNEKLKAVVVLSGTLSSDRVISGGLVRNKVIEKWKSGLYSANFPKRFDIFRMLCQGCWNDEAHPKNPEIQTAQQ